MFLRVHSLFYRLLCFKSYAAIVTDYLAFQRGSYKEKEGGAEGREGAGTNTGQEKLGLPRHPSVGKGASCDIMQFSFKGPN